MAEVPNVIKQEPKDHAQPTQTTRETPEQEAQEEEVQYKVPVAVPRVHRFHVVAYGDAVKKYDFAAARPPGQKLTEVEAIVLLMKASLGGGVYSLHKPYQKCGLWAALMINVALGYATILWEYVIVHSAHTAYGRTRVCVLSYGDLAEAALDIGPFTSIRNFSTYLRYAVDAMVISCEFGNCLSYHVRMARFLKELFQGVENPSEKELKPYIGALMVPLLAAVSTLTELKQLVPFCLISNVFSALTALASVYYGATKGKKKPTDFPLYTSLNGILEFIPICTNALTSTNSIMPIENFIFKPNKMIHVLYKGMTFITVIEATCGFFGYFGFGEDSKDPITYNFPWSGATLNLKVASVFIMCTTYAVHFYAPYHRVWHYVKHFHRENPDKFWYIERIYRCVLVAAITSIAAISPYFHITLSSKNKYIATFLTFILPSFIDLCLIWDDPGLGKFNWRFWRFVILAAFGIALIVSENIQI